MLLRDPAGIVKLTAGLSNIVGLSDVTGGDVTVGRSGFVKLPGMEGCNTKITIHRVGYPDPSAFCINVGYVLAEEICFIFCKHEAQSKRFVY